MGQKHTLHLKAALTVNIIKNDAKREIVTEKIKTWIGMGYVLAEKLKSLKTFLSSRI